MAFLSAHNLFKTYRLGKVIVPVLRGASIEVEKGEWVAVLGASGSGKSTLLHLLGGLDRLDRKAVAVCRRCGYSLSGMKAGQCPECGEGFGVGGTILFNGREVTAFRSWELDAYRRTAVGFVFQFYHLLPELNVLQNVTVGAMIGRGLGFGSSGAGPRAEALLDTFGLGARLKHRPRELSGGERQRVAIARSLINDPPVLLADEPTGNLDQKTGAAILDAVAAHRAETGLTIVMVTHDAAVAARADRVVHLVDGRVAAGSGQGSQGAGEALAAPGGGRRADGARMRPGR